MKPPKATVLEVVKLVCVLAALALAAIAALGVFLGVGLWAASGTWWLDWLLVARAATGAAWLWLVAMLLHFAPGWVS